MISKIARLATGPALAHTLTIALTPYFMYKYSPTSFGEYAFFISILGVFQAISCLRLDAVIFICEEENINTIASSAFVMSFLTSLTVSVFLLLFNYASFIYIFIALFSQSTLLIISSYLLRIDKHNIVSIFKFISIIMVPVFQLLLSFNNVSNGLVLGHALAGFLLLIFIFYKSYVIGFLRFDFYKLFYVLVQYKQFTGVNSFSVFVGSISNQLLPISIKFLFGLEMLGLVNVIHRVFVNPINFMLRIVIQAYNKEISEKIRNLEGNFAYKIFIRTSMSTFTLTILSFFILFLIIIVFDVSVGNYFPSQWSGVFTYIYPFLFLVLIQTLVVPVSQTLTFINMHKYQLIVEFVRFTFLTLLIVTSSFTLSIDGRSFINAFVVIQFLTYLSMYTLIFFGFKKCRYDN
ncbi:lipopolysaccharide biosynthesis protein [Vibrio campbellii]|uniref:lipopolysaccharide biosynthesis protein n=1 Tax=Vibrio campbellii TaxID=680 RepID=UPI00249B0218|nr:hypothetical protein [Vibrio campbellii]